MGVDFLKKGIRDISSYGMYTPEKFNNFVGSLEEGSEVSVTIESQRYNIVKDVKVYKTRLSLECGDKRLVMGEKEVPIRDADRLTSAVNAKAKNLKTSLGYMGFEVNVVETGYDRKRALR